MRGSSRVPASLESDVSLKTEEVPIIDFLKKFKINDLLHGAWWQTVVATM